MGTQTSSRALMRYPPEVLGSRLIVGSTGRKGKEGVASRVIGSGGRQDACSAFGRMDDGSGLPAEFRCPGLSGVL